jgi:enoyl-CoA hydratase/carnithine racemase
VELDEVTWSTADGVAVVRIDRPAVLNAISARPGGTRDQLLHVLAEAAGDPDVGCVVLHGAGRGFSAGGDLTGNTPRVQPIEDHRFAAEADDFHAAVRGCPVPTIAAVHGVCLGAGLALASSCDLVLAAASARFGFPEGRLGLVGATAVVPVVGRQWAKFLILTGEEISAVRARDIGLVLEVVPDDDLLPRAVDLAQRIARMPRDATLLNRRAIDGVADASGDAAGRIAGRAHDTVTLSMAPWATAPDGRTFRSIIADEGMAGLKAARAAQWTDPWLPRATPPIL